MAQKTIKNNIQKIVREYGSLLANKWPIEQLIVFGSHAKGTAHEWSDIDLCVVSPSLGKHVFDEMVALDKLTPQVDDRLEVHPMSPQDLLNPYDTLATEIRKYGIPIKI